MRNGKVDPMTQATRGATGTAEPASRPDPEVVERAARRRFSAMYKLRILRETDELPPGELGALLRREGLYYSYLTTWRKQREEGTLTGLEPRKRGRRQSSTEERLSRRVTQLEREKSTLEEQLRKSQLILAAQKNVLSLFELTETNGEQSSRS